MSPAPHSMPSSGQGDISALKPNPQEPRQGQHTAMDMNIALFPSAACPGAPSQTWVFALYPHGVLQMEDLT